MAQKSADAATESTEQAGAIAAEPRKTAAVPVTVPIAFKDFLDEKAKEGNTSVAALIRHIVASHFEYELPVITTRVRGKYAGMTDQQKKDAIAAEQKYTRDNVKALLAKMEAGGMSWEDVLSKFGPAQPVTAE